MSAIGLLSTVPWGKIVSYAPMIIETAGTLLENVKKHFGKKKESVSSQEPVDLSVAALGERIAALETNEVKQAELVSRIAEQLGNVSGALQIMSQRIALALTLSIASLIITIILMAIVLRR